MTLKYRDPEKQWEDTIEAYNEQMTLILEWEMQTDKAIKTWRKANALLEITEEKADEDLYNELNEKVDRYEKEYLDSGLTEMRESGSVDMEDYDDFNPDPPSAV